MDLFIGTSGLGWHQYCTFIILVQLNCEFLASIYQYWSFFHVWIFTSPDNFVLNVLGGSLESVIIRDGCLPENVVRKFGWDLVKGLEHIHKLGIIFSDLTPAKVCTCQHMYQAPMTSSS